MEKLMIFISLKDRKHNEWILQGTEFINIIKKITYKLRLCLSCSQNKRPITLIGMIVFKEWWD